MVRQAFITVAEGIFWEVVRRASPFVKRDRTSDSKIAHQFQAQMHLTQDFPLPQPGGVTFYLVTDAGVFSASVSPAEAGNGKYPLRQLFAAAEEVITQYRLNFP